MELILTATKTLPSGKVVFADDLNHNIYLSSTEVKELGTPKTIKVTIDKAA